MINESHTKMKVAFAACMLVFFSLSATAQTKRALVIGLGEQQDKAWNKINGDKDVPLVQEMLDGAGFGHVATLVNRQATKASIVEALKRLATESKEGDVVYVHYSGHGQQMTDVHGDEKDGLDECWIPYDAYRKANVKYHGEKHLTDDEVNVCLNAIRNRIGSDGKLLVVVDACHSGDSTRGDDTDDGAVRGVVDTLVVDSMHTRGLYEVFEALWNLFTRKDDTEKTVNPGAKPLPERWITISACGSGQVNSEMKEPAVGKLTYALWSETRSGLGGDNRELMRRIRKFVNTNTHSRPQRAEMTGEDVDKYNVTDILGK